MSSRFPIRSSRIWGAALVVAAAAASSALVLTQSSPRVVRAAGASPDATPVVGMRGGEAPPRGAFPVRHGIVAARPGAGTEWFRWVARRSGRATLAQAIAGPAPSVRVYSGGSGRLRAVASSSAGSHGVAASFRALAGHAYYLEVSPAADSRPVRLVLVPTAPRALLAPRRARSAVDSGPTISCGQAPSGWQSGPVDIACTASSPVGLLDAANAKFALVASVPDGADSADASTGTQTVCDKDGACAVAGPVAGIEIDRRPPTVACDPTPTQWSATDVSIHCAAVDTGSGLADPSQVSETFSTTVPAGQEQSVTLPAVKLCDAVGNCATAGPFGPIRVDRSMPVAHCAAPPAGWSGRQVRIPCTVSDAGSGLADPAQSTVELTTAVAAGSYDASASTNSVRVCSVVQTCVTVGPLHGVAVDLAPPDVSCSLPQTWSRSPALVRCSAADDGAGLEKPSDRSFELRAVAAKGTQTANASTDSRRVCDAVGNCAEAGPVAGVRIDEAPPAIACGRPPATWSSATVLVHCTAADPASGLARPADAAFSLRAVAPGDGSTTRAATGSRRVCSRLGVCALAGPIVGIRIDTTRPHVSCATPPQGRVTLNVQVACHATDAGSGLADAADAFFVLATHVPAGASDRSAPTDTRRICSVAGECVAVGPFAADVDRRSRPSGDPPAIAVPRRATVVLGSSSAAVAAAYPLPSARDSLGQHLPVVCSPGPAAPLAPGWRTVTCAATDGADRQTVSSFPVSVKVDPELASDGTARAGTVWRAAGIGYAPRSTVTVAFDGTPLGHGVAGTRGIVDAAFTVPASTHSGVHEVAVSGTDPSGAPLASVAAVRVGGTSSGGPPHPAADAVLPPDSGRTPTVRAAAHFTLSSPHAHTGPSVTGVLGSWWLLIALALAALALAGLAVNRRRRRPAS